MGKGILIFVILFLMLIVLGLIVFGIFYLVPLYSDKSDSAKLVQLKNPIEGLSDQQAAERFDENFILYILYAIKANELHNPPLSSDTPKINIFVEEEVFNAEVIDGHVRVSKGEIENEDIAIRTNKEESVKMLRNSEYIVQSFNGGKSSVELVADKLTLFSKGYLNLYTELTGEEPNL